MFVPYREQIRETETELFELEESLRGTPSCDRVRLLRLLKSGRCASQNEVADVLGYSPRQLRRWWRTYQENGLQALVDASRPGGREAQMSEEAWQDLLQEIRSGRVRLLKEVSAYLHERHGVTYHSLQGVLDMLRRRGIDLKRIRS